MLNFGFKKASGGTTSNVCITTLWTDTTWYGAWGANGVIDPDAKVDDIAVYGLQWKADGTFQMAFGALGNEQVPDIIHIFIYHTSQDEPLVLVWDLDTLMYVGLELALATTLIALQTGGTTSVCFTASLTPRIPVTDCYLSVGGSDGTEYAVTGLWLDDCTIFKT